MKYRTSAQYAFEFDELIVDNFAGGGGASTGIEQAIGRPVDIAINHDMDAISMHSINHPTTRHYCENVWSIDPLVVTNGQPVGFGWFSPDCKHFSKAKGSSPVKKHIRGLAWIALRWAGKTKMRVLALENVEEFISWGPLVAMRCRKTGRVIKRDGSIAIPGERTRIEDQLLTPDKRKAGLTFKVFVKALQYMGYRVEWRNLTASDYGAATSRKRFFLIARCDDQLIIWPTPTHGDPTIKGFKRSGLKKWKTAADIIDWSIPVKSIFGRKKPLAENTLSRIALGIEKFIVNSPDPFIVRIGQQGYGKNALQYTMANPLTTITTKNEHILVIPHIIKFRSGATGSELSQPLPTITAGSYLKRPGGAAHALGLIATHLVQLRSDNGDHESTIQCQWDRRHDVHAFLLKYYGTGAIGQSLDEPLHTITTKDRAALIVVEGDLYEIVNIYMRMLEPHELFAATDFPANYIIDRDATGVKVPKYKQVARCGNAVPPALARAIVFANYKIPFKSVVAA